MSLDLQAPRAIDPDEVARVLAEIADIASETLELQDVFGRIAAAVRRVIPFDGMGVVRVTDDRAVLHATTFAGCADPGQCYDPLPLTSWSPRWRPRAGGTPKIDDARRELDPTFPLDAQVLAAGDVGSGMWAAFRRGDTFAGGVWLCSKQTHAFDDQHQEVLKPIAALLGSAVEHWRIWDADRRRQQRLDKVETLLGTLVESLSLDVREVSQRLSQEMQPILPHDLMVLTELDVKAATIRIKAWGGACDPPMPDEPVALTAKELEQRIDFEILDDIPAQLPSDTERRRLILSSGLRSWLRVPVYLTGEIKGGLSFFHKAPKAFNLEDAEVARRLADRIALIHSVHQAAEEGRVAKEARERAERLEATVESLARELESRGHGRVVGGSRSWKETLRSVSRVASSETTVLITGESGTGKEVISKLIHQGSTRAVKPFVAINCAALPEHLLESELFGYERGAFTGATATKIGRIEQAAGGTLFLDEIAEMSPLVQAKFLRVLQEREFQRLGGTRTILADVRVVAATNRDLAAEIARGGFREDLYYRLHVFTIPIAPLRQRREDVLPLAEAFLDDLGRSMGRPAAGISRDAREWMMAYAWPGNVRELRNAIERAILLCDGGLITHEHLSVLPRHDAGASPGRAGVTAASEYNLDGAERGLIEKALLTANGNKSKAARLLGLTRAQLYWRLEKHSID